MDQVPFFPQLIIYGSIISGMILFLISFSEKQRVAMIESLGESMAKKAHLLMRFGGPILVCIGVSQFFIRDL